MSPLPVWLPAGAAVAGAHRGLGAVSAGAAAAQADGTQVDRPLPHHPDPISGSPAPVHGDPATGAALGIPVAAPGTRTHGAVTTNHHHLGANASASGADGAVPSAGLGA